MTKDIYKTQIKKVIIDPMQKRFDMLEKKINQIEQVNREIHITPNPAIQKVEVTNPQEATVIPPVTFPAIQKVEVTNPQEITIEKVTFPTQLDVIVKNPSQPANLQRVEKLLNDLLLKEYPITKEVTITNPTNIDIPIGNANDPKSANPSRYIPVRLTDGGRFYNAMADAYVSAAKTVFPFVDGVTGKPTPATVISGLLQTNASSSGGGGTTTSGSPQFSYQTNIPTIQTIYGQVVGDVPSQGIDTSNPVKVGGSRRATLPNYTDGTRSALHVDENGLLLIRPGQPVTISGITTLSGSANQHVFIDNIPTIQQVFDTRLTASGTQHTLVDNLPTIYTVQGGVQINDGANTANILNANGTAAAQNSQFVGGATRTIPFAVTTSGIIFQGDVSGYAYMRILLTGIGSGSVAVANCWSLDNFNFYGANSWSNGSLTTNSLGTFGPNTASLMYESAIQGKYFVFELSALTSGIYSGSIELLTIPPPMRTFGISAGQSGTWTVNPNNQSTTGTITTNASVITGAAQSWSGFSVVTITGTYAGVSFGITASNDSGTTFYPVPIYDVAANQWLAPGATITPGTNASKTYWVPSMPAGGEIKVLASAYSSGTANIRISSNSIGALPPSFMNQIMDAAGNNRGANVSVNNAVNVEAPTATGAAVPANAFYVGVSDGTNLRGVLQAANSLNSTGNGVPTAQLVAQFDDVSPSSVTENQFANLRLNSARQLYTQPVKIDTFATAAAFTITLASLANSTAGVGRQSTLITGNTAGSALITCKFTTGTSPTANTLVYVYLIRGDGTINDDNAGSSDAGITIINAPLLGTILVSAATSNATYYGVFDTKFLGSLGSTFGIALVNSSGATANATGGNFAAQYTLIT